MPTNLTPGFITLHGDKLEQLRSAVFDWLRSHPLAPLEPAIFLVQSNGVAEWLKIALAQEMGVCAATHVTLPARFLWETYRGTLGPQQAPRRSAFDKSPLVWRLMRLLLVLVKQPGFEPLRHFLADDDPERRLQLAQRLSDLMDEYQVYRADWLADWAAGRDMLRRAQGEAVPLAADQQWQALLWRAIIADVPEEERSGGRSTVHQKFVDALLSGAQPEGRLPSRVVLFGISALPNQTMQALGALATRAQVLLAVPNPCQYHWGDIIDGRELLTAKRRRQQLREGRDLAEIPYEELHAHSHPLLAAWGRLGRDFIRMLDEFDDVQATRASFGGLRVDLFSDGPGNNLLEQVQASIRDMLPLTEHPHEAPDPADGSIEFHLAHSAQREVEILHDRLLAMLAERGDRPLKPRDIVVMVPDIEVFSPAIRAVFGRYNRSDPRRIPFEIADVTERRVNPLLVALDWLLRLPQQRCLQSEVRDLLDVPAIAARFGLEESDLPRLGQWIEGSGVRWGLDRSHRIGLGLGPAGEQNAWIFGIRRMLLGYANGARATFADIEPYAEVGGLDAALAGSLAAFVETLLTWRAVLSNPARPVEWGGHARALLQAFFDVSDERDRLTCAQLEQSLQCWLDDCDSAGFDDTVPLAVLREAWLGIIDEPSLNRRFVSGGVTFCTLMPMRAVPFEVVCLLGMNDGDYPRRAHHADFDLLAQPGLARPGDRSRRDDDRYLLLEALLAARRTLYVSWVGRNARDNSEQPPSVLVSQLRDYLAAGWDFDVARLTTEHPLQPFSRRYFEGGRLQTYAREWSAAHSRQDAVPAASLPLPLPDADDRLKLRDLGRFIRQPVTYFFRERLKVYFGERPLVGQDDEPFGLDRLEEYSISRILLDDSGPQEAVDAVWDVMRERAARLGREGMLPIGLTGAGWMQNLLVDLVPVRIAWLKLCHGYPHPSAKLPVSIEQSGLRIDDWLDKLRTNGSDTVWIELEPGRVTTGPPGKQVPRGHKLIHAWVRQLTAAALGHVVTGRVVARDAVIVMPPLDPAMARAQLDEVMACWQDGMSRPLPTACKTALRELVDGGGREAYEGPFGFPGENTEPCLARLWPDFEALSGNPDWLDCSQRLYGPLAEWLATQVRIEPVEGVPDEREAA